MFPRMSMDDDVADMVAGAYAAAVDERLWPDWVWRSTRLLGGVCGAIGVIDGSGRLRSETLIHHRPQAVERYREERIDRLNPQWSFMARQRSSLVFVDTDHVDPDDPATREYLAWQASNGKLRHYATALVRLDHGGYFSGLSVHRAHDDGPTPDLTRRVMHRLLPDLQRALELGFVHAEKLSAAYWDGVLTSRGEPCLLLGESGEVLRATPAMERLLATGDGLACVHRRLTCGGGIADSGLDAFLGRLLLGPSAPDTCRIERPSGRRPYVMNGYPLARGAPMLAPASAVALVTVIDPAASPVPPPALWRAAYAFTARETDLAALLMAGHSIESAASVLRIGSATARVHLRHLFEKTGTNRQSDLARLLARFGG